MPARDRIPASLDKEALLGILRQMVRIRRFDEMAAEMHARGRITGLLHLYAGQEAVAAGSIPLLAPTDMIVSHHRGHGHALARGMEAGRVMAELFGMAT